MLLMLSLIPKSRWKGDRRLNELGRKVWDQHLENHEHVYEVEVMGLTVRELDSSEGKVNHCRISFLNKVVFCEPLDV